MQIHIKYGIISEIDATKGLAKVTFQADDNIVSAFIPALVRKTLTEKESFPYDANEYVACIMDENCEHGVIIGAVYNETDTPSFTNKDTFGIKFANGDIQAYDRNAGVYSFNGGNNNGIPKVTPLTAKINALENLVNGILNALKTTVIPLAPSGTYLFAPLYAALNDITPITAQSDLENTKVKH